MIVIYLIGMGAFGAMTPAFQGESKNHRLVYLVWYAVAFLEAVGVVTISCAWRMLSFKKTHLMERMSLLTIIVIGEGAIGVTKTVSKLMGKQGLDVEGCFLIMCIICILVSSPECNRQSWRRDRGFHADAITTRSSSGLFILIISLTATTERFDSKSGPCSTSRSSSPSSVSSKDRNSSLWLATPSGTFSKSRPISSNTAKRKSWTAQNSGMRSSSCWPTSSSTPRLKPPLGTPRLPGPFTRLETPQAYVPLERQTNTSMMVGQTRSSTSTLPYQTVSTSASA